jgi:hypothetical protein
MDLGTIYTLITQGKKTYEGQKNLYNTEKKLGSPWWKQALTQGAHFIAGATPLWNPMDWYERNRQGHLNDLNAVTRNAKGIAGQSALKQTNQAAQNVINRQLDRNVNQINRNWATAGRYASGAKQKQIGAAQSDANWALANAVAGNAQNAYQFERTTEEERAWRQAQLEANQPSTADKIGDIAGLMATIYGTNPEYFNQKLGAVGEKLGIGGGGQYNVESQIMGPSQDVFALDMTKTPTNEYENSDFRTLQEGLEPRAQTSPPNPLQALLNAPMSTQIKNSDFIPEAGMTPSDIKTKVSSMSTEDFTNWMNEGSSIGNFGYMITMMSPYITSDDMVELYTLFMSGGDRSIDEIFKEWLDSKGGPSGSPTIQSKR